MHLRAGRGVKGNEEALKGDWKALSGEGEALKDDRSIEEQWRGAAYM